MQLDQPSQAAVAVNSPSRWAITWNSELKLTWSLCKLLSADYFVASKEKKNTRTEIVLSIVHSLEITGETCVLEHWTLG